MLVVRRLLVELLVNFAQQVVAVRVEFVQGYSPDERQDVGRCPRRLPFVDHLRLQRRRLAARVPERHVGGDRIVTQDLVEKHVRLDENIW